MGIGHDTVLLYCIVDNKARSLYDGLGLKKYVRVIEIICISTEFFRGLSMKKRIVLATILTIIVALGLLLSTGGKMAGVFLDDYSVSEDGKVMTLKVGVASSMGYVRTYKAKQDENKIYLTFYSTFGLNSKISAKNTFQIDLNPSINEIYFYRGNTGYDLILNKNEEMTDWILVR